MAKITLKGIPCHTHGKLPSVGKTAPDFILVDKELNNRSLKDFGSDKKLLCIVPSLDTSVCSMMAQKFATSIKDKKGAVVLVVSADLPFAQGRFCLDKKVDNIIALSTMRSKEFAVDYGVLLEDGPLAGLCARAIVVLDEKNQVIYTELVSEITQEPDYTKALSYLK